MKPSEVRLNPRSSDEYTWKPIAGYEETISPLLTKNLSDHSIGVYRLLTKQVGKTFEAVLKEPDNYVKPEQSCPRVELERLKIENASLSQQILQLSSALNAESEQRIISEENSQELRDKLQRSEGQLHKYSRAADQFQRLLSRHVVELEKCLPVLAEFSQDVN